MSNEKLVSVPVHPALREKVKKEADEIGCKTHVFYERAVTYYLTNNSEELKKEKERRIKYKKI